MLKLLDTKTLLILAGFSLAGMSLGLFIVMQVSSIYKEGVRAGIDRTELAAERAVRETMERLQKENEEAVARMRSGLVNLDRLRAEDRAEFERQLALLGENDATVAACMALPFHLDIGVYPCTEAGGTYCSSGSGENPGRPDV